MSKRQTMLPILLVFVLGCSEKDKTNQDEGVQSVTIRNMIKAVNEKGADKYVEQFSDNVQVYVELVLKINGKEALTVNWANHFQNHPDVRSEIQHLVEIDNKVIMHDKVWLRQSDIEGSDIVEIFTFQNGKVVRVDVIQPKHLFK